ncbi:MAG TPA: hypothetical protein VKU85_16565 [bacterium]|nr:hypothetical protein [bacterium]
MNAKRVLPAALALAALSAAGCGEDGDNGMGPGDAPTGTLAVTTASSGKQIDPDGYAFQINGGAETAIGVNDSATMTLSAGTYVVTLTGVESNCQALEGLTQSVIVTEGQTSTMKFTLACPVALEDVIVFASTRDALSDLYVMNPDGTNVTRFSTLGNAYDPAVSPNGQTVAFTYNDSEIWAVDAEGLDLRLLTNQGSNPIWSADGTRIAFESDRAGTFDVWTMNADGTDAVNLTDDGATDETKPTWSPDGSRLAYTVSDGSSLKVWTINADGTGAAALTGAMGNETYAAWSPDGTEIAYASTLCRPVDLIPCGDWELHVIGADGTGDRFLTSNLTKDIRPAWSADGTRMIFTGDEPGNYDIYTMDAGGGSSVNITSHGAEDVVSPQSWAR